MKQFETVKNTHRIPIEYWPVQPKAITPTAAKVIL